MGLNGQWVEIFAAGRHTDSKGRVRDWTEEDLEHTASSYNPSHHEAPNVIGHPEHNKPAYGWVEAVKREGKKLLAKLKDVPKEFEDMVEKGLFKKRSVSFYPDGTLRHLGWLGAQPPAVKGLKDTAFKEGEYRIEYEFEEGPKGDPPGSDPPGDKPTDNPEDDMNEWKDKYEAEKKAREKAEQDAKAADDAKKKAEADFQEAERTRRKKEREDRFGKLVTDGKALPGEKAAVLAFAEALGRETTEYEFAEGQGKKSLEDHFWSFISGRGSHGLFRDMKEMDGDKPDTEFAADQKAAAMIVGDLGAKKDDK